MQSKSLWHDLQNSVQAAIRAICAFMNLANPAPRDAQRRLHLLALTACIGGVMVWPCAATAQASRAPNLAQLPQVAQAVKVMPASAQVDGSTTAQMMLGKKLFTQLAVPACAVCHTLKDAGSSGEIGPVFDELRPDANRVATAVRNGIGIMPGYASSLTAAEIAALALYVSVASGGAN